MTAFHPKRTLSARSAAEPAMLLGQGWRAAAGFTTVQRQQCRAWTGASPFRV